MKKAKKMISLASENGVKIACAESCTGGMLSAAITAIPGASEVYLGGIVSYDNRIKSDVLGVNPEDIKKYGAVSQQIAEQMAEGVIKLTGADLAVSITGIAGPTGGTEEKPIGTVWIGIAKRGSAPKAALLKFEDAGRKKIRKNATKAALDMLIQAIKQQPVLQ